MWLLVGLGNPGRKYERNRHNIGFFVIDELARRHHMGSFRDKLGGVATSGMLGLDKVLLLKPMEFMNLSGFSVQRVATFHDVPPERIVVAHDELDLDPGRVKLKVGGGHGGHNGLRSIIDQLASRDFLRVRLGIGRPGRQDEGGPPGRQAGAGYVLSDFNQAEGSPQAEGSIIAVAVATAADAMESIVARGITAAMNDFNAREVGSTAS
jgi:PTH1 family peptidyl-tRNA hydrolase